MAYVYWIHLPEHTDIFTEGYVGITSKIVSDRFRQHKSEASRGSNYTIHKAIRKHEDTIIVETVLEGEIGYCQLIESKLRPDFNIGYNIAVGGSSTTLGAVFSDETKAKISEKAKGRKSNLSDVTRAEFAQRAKERVWTDESRQKMRDANLGKTKSLEVTDKISLAHKQRKSGRPWMNGTSRLDIWVQASEIAEAFSAGTTGMKLARKFDLDSTNALTTILKKLREGWQPLLDAAYVDWLCTTKTNKELYESTCSA